MESKNLLDIQETYMELKNLYGIHEDIDLRNLYKEVNYH